jgi:hypothetical protein
MGLSFPRQLPEERGSCGMTGLKHDPRKLCNAYFTVAKRWWGAAMLCKLCIVIVGALVIGLSVFSRFTPFLAFALTVMSEWFAWRSDAAKSRAEFLLRKLDYRDSFGWEISKSELSDVLARTPAKLLKLIPPEGEREDYFASRDGIGLVHAIRNVQESAWWSKHLAEKMGQYTLTITITSTVGSLLLLISSVATVQNFDVLSSIGRVVTSVLLLVLSLGLVRLTLAYYGFKSKAQQAEGRATEFLKYGCGEIEAVKLYNDYHLDRAIAPLVPERVWKWNRDHLNELWKDYRAT